MYGQNYKNFAVSIQYHNFHEPIGETTGSYTQFTNTVVNYNISSGDWVLPKTVFKEREEVPLVHWNAGTTHYNVWSKCQEFDGKWRWRGW